MGWRYKNTISIWDPHTHPEQGLDPWFHVHKLLRKKEKLYYSNTCILWGQECILVSPSCCTHTAGSQLYPCSPTLEVKPEQVCIPARATAALKSSTSVPQEEKQMLPKLALPLLYPSCPWHKTLWYFQETKKNVPFANLRVLQYSLVFNNLET